MTGSSQRRQPTVGIYCDLGENLGVGHLVRCLALGQELQDAGSHVTLLANFAEVPWAHEQAKQAGLHAVSATSIDELLSTSTREQWIGAVVDSYLATADDLAKLSMPLAVIDDDAQRKLPAGLVVNVGASVSEDDYADWPDSPDLLLGPTYALLRPEIVRARPKSFRNRDWAHRAMRVFVVLGGTDPNGSTQRVSEELLRAAVSHGQAMDVKVVAANPDVRAALADLPTEGGSSITPIAPVNKIAQNLLWADLVVSAAGGTMWELFCVGTPVALFLAADNQLPNYRFATESGMAIGLGDLRDLRSDEIDAGITRALSAPDLNKRGLVAWEFLDGHGARRAASEVLAYFKKHAETSSNPSAGAGVSVVPATSDQSELIWKWRNDPATRAASKNAEEISWDGHQRWYENVLSAPDRHLLIGVKDSEPIGVVRFDLLPAMRGEAPAQAKDRWEISINMAPEARGRGYGIPLLLAGERWLAQHLYSSADRPAAHAELVAEIRPTNQASLMAFRRAGYRPESTPDATNECLTFGKRLAMPHHV